MQLFVADENFNIYIINGIRRRNSAIDIVRVQDIGLEGADDPTILEWATNERRILLTHDVQTMVGFAYERLKVGFLMPGIVEVPVHLSLSTAIEELLLIAECSFEGEWTNRIIFLPLT